MKIEQVNTDKLIPYANNARTHSEAQVGQIAASIREFGFNNPILIDEESSIIAGHGRVLAALKLDLQQVPCIRLTHLSENQRKAYVIADNKIALNSGWDEELLKLELEGLTDIEQIATGFSPEELDLLFNGWQSNIEVPDEVETDREMFKVSLLKTDMDQAREVITNALEQAGIEYEL